PDGGGLPPSRVDGTGEGRAGRLPRPPLPARPGHGAERRAGPARRGEGALALCVGLAGPSDARPVDRAAGAGPRPARPAGRPGRVGGVEGPGPARARPRAGARLAALAGDARPPGRPVAGAGPPVPIALRPGLRPLGLPRVVCPAEGPRTRAEGPRRTLFP